MQIQGVEQIDPQTAHKRQGQGVTLVDVREDEERRSASIPGTLWIPLSIFANRWQELPDEPLIVYCAAGARSQQAATFLQMQGRRAGNLRGGIMGWAQAGLPLETGDN